MKQPLFVAGQRWISTTELELGLGLVTDVSARHVRIVFPACEEERLYAIAGAPLNRLVYEPGDEVCDSLGDSFTVVEANLSQGRYTYRVRAADGELATLPEMLLDSHVVVRRPQERLFSGQIDRNASFELRAATLEHLHRLQGSDSRGLLGPRVQLLPHQLYIASEVASRSAPRVLLADEVGLGKTIEAGLVVHQLLVRQRAQRILVVAPATLIHQWLVELLRRFNLRFSVMDRERFDAQKAECNPFLSTQLVLTTLDLLSADTEFRQQAVAAGWDLLVVDEAHHLGWSEHQSSDEYRCIEQLAALTPGLLLLTATPEQLGRAGHFARLRLLDPDRYSTLARYLKEEEGYTAVASAVDQLLALSPGDLLPEPLGSQLEQDQLRMLAGAADSAAFEAARRQTLGSLIDRHGTGRVLFRNSRHTVSGFPRRHLIPHPLPALATPGDAEATLEQCLHPERQRGEEWPLQDARVEWLETWLGNQPQKVLLICAQAATARQLEHHLRINRGVRSAVFHEGMSLIQRDRAAAYFSEPDYGADILVCSEIGSEGRNFQFAHQLVLFDLPLNPDLLEQRIGRLDRIGQSSDVDIHVPYFEGGAQERLLRWLHQGLDAFTTPCDIGAALYASEGDNLKTLLLSDGDEVRFEELLERTRVQAESLRCQLAAGRNRLLEMSACDPDKAGALVEQTRQDSDAQTLASYATALFDHFGIDYQPQSDNSLIIRPSEQMLTDALPDLTEEGLTATFDRDTALQREDLAYLTWEHPLLSSAMELIADGEGGNSAVCTLALPPLKPGTLLVEALFRLRLSAPRGLQLQRHLPAASWRQILSSDQQELGAVLPAAKLNPRLAVVPPEVAVKLVRHARDQISTLIATLESKAALQQEQWIEQAVMAAAEEFSSSRQRLRALAAVNPNVSMSEVDRLDEDEALSLAALRKAQLQLDAVRVIVVTDIPG
ncbi:RNA polymerase-associated protein RapA [Motiliproteus sediminis]|uniref:RNA polymerase-associated protein RapA n=1 Tax=Motiliproteus sediminis TaxID=1468178 RepID=UPI001AEFD421|nr:RNA polymerase-associated protein RapA [Motiliproteus sediminis]